MNRLAGLMGRILLIVTLFGVLFSFAMFQGGFVSWFLFFSYLPIFIYHVGLLIYPIHRFQVTRHLSRYIVRSGDSITVTIRLKRSIPFPLYYCVCEEIFPFSLNKLDKRVEKYQYLDHPEKLQVNRSMKQVIFPGLKRAVELSYQLDGVPRGEHHFQAIRVKTGDVFGFIQKTHIFPVADQLVAHPVQRPIEMTERMDSFEQGPVSSNVLHMNNTNIAAGIREYESGDKFSWIDWKQTAKKHTMMTKEFEQEKSTDTIVMLDNGYYDGINGLAYEAAIELSLSLIEALKQQSSNISFFSIGKETVPFAVNQNPYETDRLLNHLTRMQPNGTNPFALELSKTVMNLPYVGLIMLVTTRLDDMQTVIKHLRQRAKQVVVHLIRQENAIMEAERKQIKQLRFQGAIIHVITEKQLVRQTIEVNAG